jgi:epoxyqueuosine reductase
MLPRDAIFDEAKKLRFASIGITKPDQLDGAKKHFDNFLELGHYGDMAWMKDKAERRGDPLVLWPDVKSIIMIGMNYGPEDNPLDIKKNKSDGDISIYARGKDYHDVFKKRLKQLARFIHQTYGEEVKVFVDTAPVMEKPLAALAGIGWQGKHTNLVSNSFGSWMFLGAIYTTLKLSPDTPHQDQCGNCTACIDICPTKAITAPYKLDARRCISYLTIEHKGHIDAEFRSDMGNHIYGCDDCLATCPWNKFAQTTDELAYKAKEHLISPPLSELLLLDDAMFRNFFQGSPIKRTGRDRFLRNVLIAAGNSSDKKLVDKIIPHMHDQNPIVRAMAVWSLKQLVSENEFEVEKQKHHPQEIDEDVLSEWG